MYIYDDNNLEKFFDNHILKQAFESANLINYKIIYEPWNMKKILIMEFE